MQHCQLWAGQLDAKTSNLLVLATEHKRLRKLREKCSPLAPSSLLFLYLEIARSFGVPVSSSRSQNVNCSMRSTPQDGIVFNLDGDTTSNDLKDTVITKVNKP